MRFRYALAFLVLAPLPSAWPAEPVVEAPKTVAGDVGDFITVRVKTDGKKVKFFPLTPGLKFFPSDLLNDPKVAVVTAAKAGKYKLLAYTGTAEGPSDPAVIEIVIGGQSLPPVDPAPTDPPVDPPAPTGKLYFLIVRADGPTDPEFTKLMASPAWDGLRSSGHSIGAATLSEATPLNVSIPRGTQLPVVVTLRVSTDGKKSAIVRGPIPLPTTTDGISKLPEGVK